MVLVVSDIFFKELQKTWMGLLSSVWNTENFRSYLILNMQRYSSKTTKLRHSYVLAGKKGKCWDSSGLSLVFTLKAIGVKFWNLKGWKWKFWLCASVFFRIFMLECTGFWDSKTKWQHFLMTHTSYSKKNRKTNTLEYSMNFMLQ